MLLLILIYILVVDIEWYLFMCIYVCEIVWINMDIFMLMRIIE